MQQDCTLLRLLIAQQPGFSLFQGQQHCLPVVSQQFGGLGIRCINARLHLGAVEEAPVNPQCHTSGAGAAGKQVRAIAGQRTYQTVQGKTREQISTGHANTGAGRGQATLGGLNIRAPAQYVARATGRYRRTAVRQLRRYLQQRHQRGGRLPGQHTDAMHFCADTRLQLRNHRPGGIQLSTCPHLIEQRAAAGLQARADDIQRRLLQTDVLFSHAQLLLQPAQLEIAAGHLTGQSDLQRLPVGARRLQFGFAGLGGAAQSPEQIQFPTQRGTGLVQLHTALIRLGALHLRQPLSGGTGASGDARQLIAARTAQQCFSFLIARQRRLQALVFRQGLLDQHSQQRVFKALPEQLLIVGHKRARRLIVDELLQLHRFRGLVIRAHCTGTEQRCDAKESCQLTHAILLPQPFPTCLQNAWPASAGRHRTPGSAAGRTGSRRSSR